MVNVDEAVSVNVVDVNAPDLVNEDDLMSVTVTTDGNYMKFSDELLKMEESDLMKYASTACHFLGARLVYSGGERLNKRSIGYNDVPVGHAPVENAPIFTVVWRGESLEKSSTRIVPREGSARMNRGEWDLKVGQALEHIAFNTLLEFIDEYDFSGSGDSE